jgi:hypothetical protein
MVPRWRAPCLPTSLRRRRSRLVRSQRAKSAQQGPARPKIRANSARRPISLAGRRAVVGRVRWVMADGDRLRHLARRYGLRNINEGWLRQNRHYSLENLENQIASRDLSDVCRGTLPFRIADAHDVKLDEPALVQVEDVINLSSSDDPRGTGLPSTTLLVRFSDGRQSFAGVELLPLGGRINVRTVPGSKLRLEKGTAVRRGRVLLTQEHVVLVGRMVPSGNVWGAEYEASVARAMRRAGLQAAGAVSFDAIAGAQSGGPAGAPITGLGGIADMAEESEDDEAFWIQAMAAEDSRAAHR